MGSKVFIIGSAGHAKVIIDIFEKTGYEILGLLDVPARLGESTLGHAVIGSEADLPLLLKAEPAAQVFVAIGDNSLRKKVSIKVLELGPNTTFARAVHPGAVVAPSVIIGQGTAVMAGAVVNPATIVGNFTIINSHAAVDHDCQLGDYSTVAPGATLGGNVILGELTAISIGATIKHGISIGRNTVVGAGGVVLKDVGDNKVVYGVPAKEVREREEGDKYL